MTKNASVAAERELAVRIVEFNLRVASFAHRSWYPPGLSASVCDSAGRLDPRAERGLSVWLMEEWGLDQDMDWAMDLPQKRLWLLDRASLERLAYELSLAMHRNWLARIIDGATLRVLQARVDSHAWRFVVEELPDRSFHHRSPTVDFSGSESSRLEAALKEDGAQSLFALLQPAWSAVSKRARLYFDTSFARRDVLPFAPARCDRALELICDHFIPRRFPQWAWLF